MDLESFLGRPLNWKERIFGRFAPLFPPALHANILYRRAIEAMKLPENYGRSIFEVSNKIMGHQIKIDPISLSRIPMEGAFLMVSNHPTGVLDGQVDAAILRQRYREDFAIVVAHFLEPSLSVHPELKDHFIYVDRRHRKTEDENIRREADALNRREFRRMIEARKAGRPVILYPTGSIASQLPRADHPVTYDAEWDPTTVTFAKSMRVIVPTFKVIRNSDTYLKLKKESLTKSRQAYFAEALNKEGKTVEVYVGEPFTWEDVERDVPERPGVSDDQIIRERVLYIRARVDALDPFKLAPEYAK